MDYKFYYNNIPGIGLTRNNLIYTSLISSDKKTFVKWYTPNSDYHKGQNEVIDPQLMEEKFQRELYFLNNMAQHNPEMVPKILEVNTSEQKIYLEVDGLDFWNSAKCTIQNYDSVVPNWQEQMIAIIEAHNALGWHKYSMHPSSYFVVDGKLKSINYFFTYQKDEKNISISEVESHIHSNRQNEIRKHLEKLGIEWTKPQPWKIMDQLCWESFRTNYPLEFINRVKECIK
jgi:hypothetical protein